MAIDTFVRRSTLEASAATVWRWHGRPGALDRLTPPWESVQVEERPEGLHDGSRAILRVRVGPLTLRWVAEHRDCVPGHGFSDVQVSGPFHLWEHRHTMIPLGARRCVLEDHIRFALPLGRLGRLLGRRQVLGKLRRMFDFRHETTRLDIAALERRGTREPLRVLLVGASGLVGRALQPLLSTAGHEVRTLLHPGSVEGLRQGTRDSPAGPLDAETLEGYDAIVDLAGEELADGRWSRARTRRTLRRQVDGSRLLAETLSRLARPPSVFIGASGTGYYGSRGDAWLDEASSPGTGFLADLCREWEGASTPAHVPGVRTIHLRLGLVLSPSGGPLARMLWPFCLGAGGRLGSGQQFVSWIGLDDAVGAILHCIETESLEGPVNVVAPEPVTNAELTRTLGRVLSRPTVLTLPRAAVRLTLGDLADELLAASTRVQPRQLQESLYPVRHPTLEGSLRYLLGRTARPTARPQGCPGEGRPRSTRKRERPLS